MEKKTLNLKMILTIVFWGSLWGIVEATLGTILHLPSSKMAGMYLSSSAIIIPIAYCLMANCYKKTNQSFYAVYLMGVVAALIKLSVAFVIGFVDVVWEPAIYIILEALAMGSALAIFRPTNVLSLKTFGSIVVANTVYQFSFLVVKTIKGSDVFYNMATWSKMGEKYLFTVNGLAMLYTLAIGALSYGIILLVKKLNLSTKFDMNKIVYSPIAASLALMVSIGLTIGLSVI